MSLVYNALIGTRTSDSVLAAVPHYLHSISPYEDIVSSETCTINLNIHNYIYYIYTSISIYNDILTKCKSYHIIFRARRSVGSRCIVIQQP